MQSVARRKAEAAANGEHQRSGGKEPRGPVLDMLSGFFAGVEGAVIHERRLYSDTGPILSPMRPKASVDPSTGPGPVNRRASYNSAGSMCCSLAAQWDIEESKVDIEGHEEEAEFAIRQDAARRLLDRVRRAFQDCPPQTGAEAAQMCYDTLVNSDDWPDSFELQVQKVLARQVRVYTCYTACFCQIVIELLSPSPGPLPDSVHHVRPGVHHVHCPVCAGRASWGQCMQGGVTS
jgi:hypothetical protein